MANILLQWRSILHIPTGVRLPSCHIGRDLALVCLGYAGSQDSHQTLVVFGGPLRVLCAESRCTGLRTILLDAVVRPVCGDRVATVRYHRRVACTPRFSFCEEWEARSCRPRAWFGCCYEVRAIADCAIPLCLLPSCARKAGGCGVCNSASCRLRGGVVSIRPPVWRRMAFPRRTSVSEHPNRWRDERSRPVSFRHLCARPRKFGRRTGFRCYELYRRAAFADASILDYLRGRPHRRTSLVFEAKDSEP